MWYLMDESGQPVACEEPVDWSLVSAEWQRHQRVAYDDVDGVMVSTVFLSLDHSWGGGPPVLWETMIFGGERDQEQHRYTSAQEALEMHAKIVESLKRGDFQI